MAYKAIWLLLQICFSVYDILRLFCCHILRQLALRSYDQRRNKRKKEEETNFLQQSGSEEKNFLRTCSRQLSKLPSHLSIIIGPEEDLENELISQLINYSLYTKIDFISLYDTRLGKRRCDLQNFELLRDVKVKKLGEKHFLWTIDKTCLGNGNTNGYQNGFKSDNFIQILEVQSFQGHALIGDVCRDLFERRQSCEVKEMLQTRTILSQHLDDEMSVRLWRCKDPELCIIFSKHMCTFGMFPWQMRFTEFYLHQQGDFFDARTFAKMLFQYARCEQRRGK